MIVPKLLLRTPFFLIVLLMLSAAAGTPSAAQPAEVLHLRTAGDWTAATAAHDSTQIRSTDYAGGNFDVLDDGALLLQKTDTTRRFWHADDFAQRGRWTSAWMDAPDADSLRLEAEVRVYGQPQDMTAGWTKFAGGPLVAPEGWTHTTAQTLAVPDTLWPQDQALVRAPAGPHEGKWLLFFNVGGWAVGGWAAAVADSLAPLKRGENPFRLLEPYPLFAGNAKGDSLGYHAPNDWLYADGRWLAPDESRDQVSRLWTSAGDDLTQWTNRGPIDGIEGHDPGLVYDGERFHLFTEDGEALRHLHAADPLGAWTARGPVLDVGDHTGDADAAFFNNAWHLFFDDGPHLDYEIGYAQTTPAAFPEGWQLTNDVFGPRRPDQGQAWDDPGADGNGFGTGDADIAVEGSTLYLTHERPVGLAFKELDLTGDAEQTVRARLEFDRDGNGQSDAETPWARLTAEAATALLPVSSEGRVRLVLDLQTDNERESPMLRALRLAPGGG